MKNTLIDNSANLKMVDTLKTCLKTDDYNELMIATGYWDLPGTTLITEELNLFLSRSDAKFRLLIGKDPYVFATQVYECMHPEVPDCFYELHIRQSFQIPPYMSPKRGLFH